MALYNFLIGVPFKLITHNLANVDSIGTAVFIASVLTLKSAHKSGRRWRGSRPRSWSRRRAGARRWSWRDNV